MWANAQRDGGPAEYRCRPLLNAAVWLTPTTRVPCSNAAKTQNPLKFAGVPQTNETISAKVVRWCADGDFLHHFCVLYFQRASRFRPAF